MGLYVLLLCGEEESVACNKGTVNLIKTYLNEIFIQARKCKLIKHNPNIQNKIIAHRTFKEFKKAGNVTNEFYRLKDAKFPILI